MKKSAPETTHFLNVDLDLFSKSNLQPLVTAMGNKVLVLFIGRYKRTYRAHLELTGLSKNADSTVRSFCTLIRRLPSAALKLWDGANRRDFNIGVQAGLKPDSYEIPLATDTLIAASKINARIVLTIYGPCLKEWRPQAKRPA
jgi:hypothetical protein